MTLGAPRAGPQGSKPVRLNPSAARGTRCIAASAREGQRQSHSMGPVLCHPALLKRHCQGFSKKPRFCTQKSTAGSQQ